MSGDHSPSIRLYDRVVSGQYKLAPYDVSFVHPASWEAYSSGVLEELRASELIVADNVDDFVFATYPVNSGYGLRPKDIPNLVPPFPSFFIDFRPADPVVRQKGIRQFGALVQALEISDDSARKFLFAWRALFTMAQFCFVTTATQVICSDEIGDLLDSEIVRDPQLTKMGAQPTADGEAILSAFSAPVLTTISFLNCGNVNATLRSPDANLSKAHKKRTGQWLSSYRVIDIRPMSRLVAAEIQDGSEGAPARAAHLVRGHFKRYLTGKGLFGKQKGTFFWHQQSRGSLEAGERKHEYRIRMDGSKGGGAE